MQTFANHTHAFSINLKTSLSAVTPAFVVIVIKINQLNVTLTIAQFERNENCCSSKPVKIDSEIFWTWNIKAIERYEPSFKHRFKSWTVWYHENVFISLSKRYILRQMFRAFNHTFTLKSTWGWHFFPHRHQSSY